MPPILVSGGSEGPPLGPLLLDSKHTFSRLVFHRHRFYFSGIKYHIRKCGRALVSHRTYSPKVWA